MVEGYKNVFFLWIIVGIIIFFVKFVFNPILYGKTFRRLGINCRVLVSCSFISEFHFMIP